MKVLLKHKKRFWCEHCLNNSFKSEKDLIKHLELCKENEVTAVKMPEVNNKEVELFCCDRCLVGKYSTQKELNEHLKLCCLNDAISCKLC
jgi:hypothetical protein